MDGERLQICERSEARVTEDKVRETGASFGRNGAKARWMNKFQGVSK